MSKRPRNSTPLTASDSAISYHDGDLGAFLSGAKLGAAQPLPQTSPAAQQDDDSGSEFSGGDMDDERLLMLRPSGGDDEDSSGIGAGDDWMAEYAGSDEEDDDEDGDGDGDDDDHDGSRDDADGDDDDDTEEAEAPKAAAAAGRHTAGASSGSKHSASASASALVAGAAAAPVAGAHIPVFLDNTKQKPASKAATAAASADATGSSAKPRPGKTTAAPTPKRPLPAAFVPAAASASGGAGGDACCVVLGNVPHDATADAIAALLKAAAKAKPVRVHLEVRNNGDPAGLAYAEFGTAAGAAAVIDAGAAGRLNLSGRPLRAMPYTPELNYRNPDGSRKRDKKGKPGKDVAGLPRQQHGARSRKKKALKRK